MNNLTLISPGDFYFAGTLLSNFEGLDNLTEISNTFRVDGNDLLLDFTGLNSLQFVGGISISENELVRNFNGLINLNTIGNLHISYNSQLENLNGLESLVSLNNGDISIYQNDDLTSLEGLDNVDYNTINHVHIQYNDNLSECSVLSICAFLFNIPSASYYTISQNSQGCSTRQEILDNCEPLSINENVFPTIELYPNPVENSFIITSDISIKGVKIYSIVGILVKEFDLQNEYFVSDLTRGMYFVILETEFGEQTMKILKI